MSFLLPAAGMFAISQLSTNELSGYRHLNLGLGLGHGLGRSLGLGLGPDMIFVKTFVVLVTNIKSVMVLVLIIIIIFTKLPKVLRGGDDDRLRFSRDPVQRPLCQHDHHRTKQVIIDTTFGLVIVITSFFIIIICTLWQSCHCHCHCHCVKVVNTNLQVRDNFWPGELRWKPSGILDAHP